MCKDVMGGEMCACEHDSQDKHSMDVFLTSQHSVDLFWNLHNEQQAGNIITLCGNMPRW